MPRTIIKDNFVRTIGRRKTATARVQLVPGTRGAFLVNGREWQVYFPTAVLQKIVRTPLEVTGKEGAFDISAKVEGGGIKGQAGAVAHAISRALLAWNPDWRKSLKTQGLLTRDPRMKERKKAGLKKARRAPQWSKR